MILSAGYPLQTLPDVVVDRELWGIAVLYSAKKNKFATINISNECTFLESFHSIAVVIHSPYHFSRKDPLHER